MANFFTPGFGIPPHIFAGRSAIMQFFAELSVQTNFNTPTPIIFSGVRGMGKTTLLVRIQELFNNQKWSTFFLEAGKPDLFRAQSSLLQLRDVTASINFRVFQGSAQFSPLPTHEDMLDDITALLAQRRVLVIIDEFQELNSDDLQRLGSWLQERIRDNLPLVFIGAGLPTDLTSSGKISYIERADWRSIAQLDDMDSLTFLVETFRAGNIQIPIALAQSLLSHANGYPYALQIYGSYTTLSLPPGAQEIDEEHVALGVQAANEFLENNFFAARWRKLPEQEQEYLSALSQIYLTHPGEDITNSKVSAALGKTPKQTSYLADRLVKKGNLIKKSTHLQLLLPDMAEWIERVHL